MSNTGEQQDKSLSSPHFAAAVLEWYLENGVDEAVLDVPNDRLAAKPLSGLAPAAPVPGTGTGAVVIPPVVSGTPESKAEAERIAASCGTLEELKAAIVAFDGLAIKKTAMNLVFSSGNPAASVMMIGDAPETDDDRSGDAFSGEIGAFTDKMFAAIGLSRTAQEPEQSLYLTNLLNWRPPGNRTPSPAEIEISLPFLLRHIALARPKIVYMTGGLAAKALLKEEGTIAKLRGKTFTVAAGDFSCPAFVSYPPSFLLRTPLKKREAWDDLQKLRSLLFPSENPAAK